jgi:hypothetical protein
VNPDFAATIQTIRLMKQLRRVGSDEGALPGPSSPVRSEAIGQSKKALVVAARAVVLLDRHAALRLVMTVVAVRLAGDGSGHASARPAAP